MFGQLPGGATTLRSQFQQQCIGLDGKLQIQSPWINGRIKPKGINLQLDGIRQLRGIERIVGQKPKLFAKQTT